MKKQFKLSKKEKQKIIEELQKRGVISRCPMCNNNHFIMADAYFTHTFQKDLRSLQVGGPGIPTIAIICSRCGFVSEHAIGVLGILDTYKREANNSNEKKNKNNN